ncbi:hypothetical protein ACJMK2_019691 [Sinanodonta woodiana]|uniref:Uncharacterized protein n=1 Tax=Sinanodonta woodiana TaxID=1069815 RepID=A0ABD3TWP1_SINWO
MKSIQQDPNVSCDLLPYIDVSDIDVEDVQLVNEDKINDNSEEDEDADYSHTSSKVDANQDILQDVQTLLEEIQIPFLTNKDETVVCSTDSSIREYQDKKTPLLCRHPPPYSGRDDDIVTLKVVLDDVLEKAELSETNEKVMFVPDYKIARNLFKLIDGNKKYATFLPEFPVLHLRKSKIMNLISAYETSGLIHILKYMRDDDIEKDCSKLVTIENIEIATQNVWRLSAALHISRLSSHSSTHYHIHMQRN